MTGNDPPAYTPRSRNLPPDAGRKRKRRWQTIGNDGTQSQRLSRGTAALCSFGCMVL